MAVSFDCFGTLVTADRPAEPWEAVAAELSARGVSVPGDWEAAYRSSHVDVGPLVELSLVDHVEAALASRGVAVENPVLREALLAAFDGPVTVRDGGKQAVEAASARGPVGVCSNCSLPGLVERTIERADLDGAFDAIVTSVDCGWRKPHDIAFTSVCDRLGVEPDDLVHVGDDPRCDGGGETAGVTVVLVDEVPLAAFPEWLEAER
ncbi:HAD family hydrolase [Halobacteriales archaeon Cl-PHB]